MKKSCLPTDQSSIQGLKMYVGGKNEFIIRIFYLWLTYFLENVNEKIVELIQQNLVIN